MTAWSVLERHFGGLTPDEVDAELASVPQVGATPSSAAAAAYLAAHGGPDLDGEPGPHDLHQRRALTAARTLADTVGSALTLEQTADLLSLSRSRVSHRLTEGALWAFTLQGRRYVPRWQFTPEHRTIPGLPVVVAAIPRNRHPLAIAAFMTTPRADFDGRSPVEWLISGGDPTVVATWLDAMAHE